ncbi:MAG: DUF6922 domain-containing protein [Persicimonas sp.]
MSHFSDHSRGLPDHLAELFWEYDTSDLDWAEHRDFIVRRVLSHGRWEQLCWLREQLGDDELRRIIEKSEGRDLSPRQLRFWQLILDLPAAKVDRWLQDTRRQTWDNRAQ